MEVSKTMSKTVTIMFIAILVLFTIGWRLIPHLANFAPVSALALLSGMMLRSRTSFIPVVIALGVSDAVLGGYHGMIFTWLGFASVVILGRVMRKADGSRWLVPVGAVGSSLLFFIISNFGVWVASGMYALTLAGLAQCYVMGLPFLIATVVSDVFFVTVFVTAREYITAGMYRMHGGLQPTRARDS